MPDSKAAARQHTRRIHNISRGLCGNCGHEPLVTTTLGDKCLKVLRDRRAKRKAAACCQQCGNPSRDQRLCSKCRRGRATQKKRLKTSRQRHGACNLCGTATPDCNKKTCKACRGRTKKHKLAWVTRKLASGLCTICGKNPLIDKRRCQKCVDKHAAVRRSLRLRVLAAYGAVCKCCGEADEAFLQIDHIDGGGRRHLKEIGNAFYRWLEINKFPAGFQVLCCNCNFAKARCGICPHERARREAKRRRR